MVRRINRRWIVHGGLRESAETYIAALERSDPARLRHSCALAMELVHTRAAQSDPKPWFYAGLFALATPDEVRRCLNDHPLTRMVWEALHDVPNHDDAPESLEKLSHHIATAIRQTNPNC